MTNPILRDCHPAAPRTPQNEDDYKMSLWINQELPAVDDVATRIYLIGERGELTSEIWNKARRSKAG